MNHFYFLIVQRRNSVFVNCNVFLNKYSLNLNLNLNLKSPPGDGEFCPPHQSEERNCCGPSTSLLASPWRNRLARSAVDRKGTVIFACHISQSEQKNATSKKLLWPFHHPDQLFRLSKANLLFDHNFSSDYPKRSGDHRGGKRTLFSEFETFY